MVRLKLKPTGVGTSFKVFIPETNFHSQASVQLVNDKKLSQLKSKI